MTSISPTKLIFLDFDGCVTSLSEGNYFNPDPLKYRPSEKIVSLLKQFCKDENAKIVISSNWRKFKPDGEWRCSKGIFKNPLGYLKQMLGEEYIFDTLPTTRHVKKSQALSNWLSETGYSDKFAILDDDLSEDFQLIEDFNIKDHFILVDPVYGITSQILNKVKEKFKL